tara:strand:- start:633 stop:788 length:156 start_codon:yes stop_codon:yes gene_type:complete
MFTSFSNTTLEIGPIPLLDKPFSFVILLEQPNEINSTMGKKFLIVEFIICR